MDKHNSGKTVSVLGAGFSLGQRHPGVQQGPSTLLTHHLIDRIQALGWQVNKLQNLDFNSTVKTQLSSKSDLPPINFVQEAGTACQLIATHVESMVRTADFCLVLGGDHSIAIGSIAGVAQAGVENLRIIWVDAHADFNTPSSSQSHNLHGMPLSALTNGFDLSQYPNFEFLAQSPKIKPEHVALIGVRSIDPQELALLEKSGIHFYTMAEIDRYGIDAILQDAEVQLGKSEQDQSVSGYHYHLSFDIDAIDPAIAPNTGTCVPGGLTYREAHYIAEYLHQTGYLKSMDLVEVNPGLDKPDQGSTFNIAIELIESALGKRIASPRSLRKNREQ